MIDESVLTAEELTAIRLRSLYKACGYLPYKMSKFEEYDIYAHNKDFLVSNNIITFTDLNGRLMALKPDVTLSIVRSGRDEPGRIQKVYYNENVYRTGTGRSYKEINQVGLECIGDIDRACLGEVLRLAAESLRQISEQSILCISDLDIIEQLLEQLNVQEDGRAELMRCIGEKNLHGLSDTARAIGISEEGIQRLSLLVTAGGRPEQVISAAAAIPGLEYETEKLKGLVQTLNAAGYEEMLQVDFSVTGDLRYYNGLVFRGYVSGVAESVITGGQYDRLMRKMGRTSRAAGFAVYLSSLEQLPAAEQMR
ncbi:MAG: ATP phosphoribosyltransferase regulatory subunit [Oscillospiraceae bacterium]|nr:ATP phosphoribosyltransferase regulatory subunit [Oscillospiraceae bacterium]